MKALYALCLSLAAFAFARPAQAELKYLSYELQSGTAKELTAEEVAELNVADKRWHETITAEDGTQTQTTEMLFVQDTSISTDYYIGVFEVTQAQANLLRLGDATGSYGYAYGVAYSPNDFPFATTPTLNNKPGLTFPTSAQWLAYASDAEGKPATSEKGATNLYGGGSNWSSADLQTWYDENRKWEEGDNAHGVIDIFGNAAEYTCDPGKGPDGSAVVAFYGWPTHSFGSTPYSWKKLTELTSPAETRLDASISGNFSAIWGARLVYTVPAARTYTLTVTLDGAEFSKREGIAVDESVTVTPPTPEAGQRLSGRTVTQGSLTFTEAVDAPITFTMPTSDVTIAYTTEPCGTITVEGGTAKVTHGEETVTAGKNTQVVTGDTVTLTAREPAAYENFVKWTVTKGEGEPTPIEPTTDEETQESVYSYTIPALQGGETFAFTAHFEKIPYATITVKNGHAEVNGETVTEAVDGDKVTLVANAPGKHQRFSRWETPDGITLNEDNSFTVSDLTEQGQELAFTAHFEKIPYTKLSVVNAYMRVNDGRLVAEAEVEAYYRVTLDAHPTGQYQFLLRWDGTEGTKVSIEGDSPSFTVTEELVNKEEVTFTAVTAYYPRVLVVGGTASASASEAKGNGYYEPGTTLSLKAEEPEGYTFEKWTVSGDTRAGSLSDSAYTIAAANQSAGTTVTLTATYKKDEDAGSETVTPADIHLGSTKSGSGYTAPALFGWTPADSETTIPDTYGNRYLSYPYENAGLFAILPLTGSNRTITYQDAVATTSNPPPPRPVEPSLPEGGSTDAYLKEREEYLKKMETYWKAYDAWQASASISSSLDTSRLLLRRVSPTTEGKRDFYLGVFETPIGNIANLEKLAKGSTFYDTSSKAPFCARTTDARDYPDLNSYLTLINGQFKVSARFPTKADVIAVGDQTRANNPGAGYGLGREGLHQYYDINLVCTTNAASSMVVAQGGNSKPVNADGMKVDPYGFYGLWGNCWEASSNDAGFGGSTDFPQRVADLTCRTDVTNAEYPAGRNVLALRPAIDVEESVVIYVGEKSAATAVQVAPGQKLFADPSVKPTRAKYNFTGWTLGETPIKAGENHTVTTEDDGKMLVANWESIPDPITSVTVKCVNCLGPATAYAGQSVKVYPPEGFVFDGNTPVTASGNNNTGVKVGTLSADDGTVTVTFPAPFSSSDSITLTGKVEKIVNPGPPELPSPGYRFRLR